MTDKPHQQDAIDHIRDYLASQVRRAVAEGAATPSEPEPKGYAATPLVERVALALRKLPDGLETNGVSITDLQPLLRGRRGKFAHSGEIAQALRDLGWTCRRSQTLKNIAAGKSGIRWFRTI